MTNRMSPMKKILLYTFLTIGVIVSVFPFYWMFVGATNPSGEIFNVPPNFFPGTHGWENFKNLNENIGIIRVMGNSLFITLSFTALSTLICTAAGYAFAKFRFKGRNQIFFMLLVAIMIPYHVTLIPLFEIFSVVNWLNTFQAVILPQLSYPFAIFLMRQNMQSIPDSLLEAARVDGQASSISSSVSFFRLCDRRLRLWRSFCSCSSGTISSGRWSSCSLRRCTHSRSRYPVSSACRVSTTGR
ncbi:carbohydrate ABC transporter permease [Salimicrobium sp. PL1-032A]|uniref:carbohydrate ABC transporter permease n=1 Tax=Salimicrobium sp. PL1-032A TaxID=3095364 RepID=UPI00326124D0